MSDYSFTKRLAILIGIDTVIAIGDSYVPTNWTPLRTAIAALQLGFMAYTMGIAIKRVLQDY